ncbi:hypothetical protein LINPERHAP1_LOCUS24704 [Linum perenne]
MGDRRIGVAVDFSPCSVKALKWAIDNIVRDALIPLVELADEATMHKYGVKPDPESLDILNTVSKEKKVCVDNTNSKFQQQID